MLAITARGDLYGAHDTSFCTAEEIAEARFIGFTTGSHLLLGQHVEPRSQVSAFLLEQRGFSTMAT